MSSYDRFRAVISAITSALTLEPCPAPEVGLAKRRYIRISVK
jgi:hypothetical protein